MSLYMHDVSFKKDESIRSFQAFNKHVYELPDNRNFSLSDLLSHHQRFTMRALKGIRKNEPEKIALNLADSFSWLMAIANRLHFDIETIVWARFPHMCSYCGACPCACKKIKPKKRAKIKINNSLRPKTLAEFQRMFEKIYPSNTRTLEHAGVHLGEETGEVNEAAHVFMGQHKESQLKSLEEEMADCASCIFGVANSAKINLAEQLEKLFYKNCLACHRAPCKCTLSYINNFKF